MTPLAIDFVAAPRRQIGVVGFVLFLAGAATLAAVSFDLDDKEEQRASAEARLRSLTRAIAAHQPVKTAAVAPGRSANTAASASGPAGKILPQLKAPWHTLLGELESASGLPVALLGVDADARSRHLRLTGEAKSIDDMLAFVERLRESKHLQDVFLLGHEARTVGAVSVIAFTVAASWPEARDGAR
ncbi:PilN domain-containing protein [Rhodocyclus tenuis]|uniref:Uncharacterized protein n=1 Tax=Rhodocyclus tenuis TaxID=1066 RepID=A0A840GCD9_RHOTE|nr:PilN domain-containing protein [Rhodocyclus tenuis]MBB4248318.1 hypothetical protein [Rhodocyclus tenuis]